MSHPETAISDSPLNRIPPEVRGIIYSYLLVQPFEVLVSFKRFRGRRNEKHGLFPEICMHCSQTTALCKCSNFTLNKEFFYQHQPLPCHTISTGILSTCRLLYDEAAPLLYKQNSFHFADPTAIERFASAIDRNHSHMVEKLILTIHSARREVRYRWETTLGEHKPLAIAKHFPHLKNIVIKLRGQYELLSDTDLKSFCTALAQKLQPCKEIEWVHVNGLMDPGAIFGFAPVVQQSQSSHVDGRFTRTHVTACWSREGWENVTIWWGHERDEPPYTPPFQLFNLRLKRVLRRPLTQGSKPAVSEVCLPYAVAGVGGTKGGFAFM